jgi:hypothetical protein
MTIQLKTMLFPTGTFALIADGEDFLGLTKGQHKVLQQFAKGVGAVELLVAPKASFLPVDALVDEQAVHTVHEVTEEEDIDEVDLEVAGEEPEEEQAAPVKTLADYLNTVFAQMTRPQTEHHLHFEADPATSRAFDLVQGGADVSPAGLIVLTDEQKAEQDGLTEEELTGMTAMAPVAQETPTELAVGTRVFILADESVVGTDLSTENYGNIGWNDGLFGDDATDSNGNYLVTTDSGLVVLLRPEDVRPLDGVDPVSVAAGDDQED